MADTPYWHTCPTCNRVLNVGDVCDTPECVSAAAGAKERGKEPAPETTPAQ